ncbi:phenylalanine ammonia-lyase [Lindgomyces ingoldianus]|uniref:Phenylalanine ammonia-lyase n=1 Tax=Lindgomyces ingoldianus TaxID=673940 RepID=A0ACB6QAD4_9PLEO|nr:phenylalanine ammonia-lyase [Lindgomyces ingoldianus]KAF2463876.1 phenylalanine ammonia-lyase [Lindgomyces ingoldianus]
MQHQLHPPTVLAFHSDIVLEEWKTITHFIESDGLSVSITGEGLQVAEVVAVARYRRSVFLVYQRMEGSLKTLQLRLRDGEVIYGVNTGFGGTADVRNQNTRELQRTLIRELHHGILAPTTSDQDYDGYPTQDCDDTNWEVNHLPETWTRATILIRLNSLVKGNSAVRAETVSRMRDLLIKDIIPIVPLRSSISASGNLSPLSYIGGAIQGKPTIRVHPNSSRLNAASAFRQIGLEPVELDAKEGLAIVNGTVVSTATASLALHDAHVLPLLSQIITAMSAEALHGTAESFDSFFSECRPHTGQIDAARNISSFLKDSKLLQDYDASSNNLRQDRYSIRTAPQWIGPVLEDLVLAHEQLSIELNSATDNPLIDPEGRVLHGGNFQAKAITSAMEKTRQGVQSLGRMQFSQCVEIINPATSCGLPANLVAEDPGTSYIFKGTDIYVAALQAELGFLSNPMNHVQTAELGNQSLNSLALLSARYTHLSNDLLSQMVATHLLALCQALDLRAMQSMFVEHFKPLFDEIILSEYFALVTSDKDLDTNEVVSNDLETAWKQLVASFSSTVGLYAAERFPKIALAIHVIIANTVDQLSTAQALSRTLERQVSDAWNSFRAAYLEHGDASSLLGTASKQIYGFIRKDLKVPFLCRKKLMTPDGDIEKYMHAPAYDEAPTVGSYTSRIYKALKDGLLAKKAVNILQEVRQP